MNTRKAWNTADDDWTPNEPTLRVIQQAVKSFSDYEKWMRVLREADSEFAELEEKEG